MNSNERDAIRDDWWSKRKGEALTMFNDPGHAWLAVTRKELEGLDILDRISPYSYQKGVMVYLGGGLRFYGFCQREDRAEQALSRHTRAILGR
jgi:hypothetical protein